MQSQSQIFKPKTRHCIVLLLKGSVQVLYKHVWQNAYVKYLNSYVPVYYFSVCKISLKSLVIAHIYG